jgi:hypothetical protein
MSDRNMPSADVHVELGLILRARRLKCRLTPEHLAATVGIPVQTLLGHEDATLPLTVPRLYDLAAVLGTEPAAILQEVSHRLNGRREFPLPSEDLALIARFGEEVILGTQRIRNETVRKAVVCLLREIAARS